MQHSPPKAVSLSECHFQLSMCSAISAAATHSVPAAQSRCGPWTGDLWVQRFRAAPEPSLHREAEQCPEPPGASLPPAVECTPRLSSARMSATTQTPSCNCGLVLPRECIAKSPQGIPAAAKHCFCFTIPSRNPHPPSRCAPQGPLLGHLTLRLELCSSTLTIHPTQGQTQPWECLLFEDAGPVGKLPGAPGHSRWSHCSALAGCRDATEGTGCWHPCTQPARGTLALTDGIAELGIYSHKSVCVKRKCKPRDEVQQEGMKKKSPKRSMPGTCLATRVKLCQTDF